MGGLGAVWRLLKRHKRKFFFVGAAATGAYFTWNYVVRWVSDYKSRQMAAAFAAARRQTHFETNRRTCNATIYSMMPGLRESLMKELNCEKLTEQLQLKPANKVYVWSELKILSFTRVLVSIYSTSILILTMRIQLNVIGGCMYARSGDVNETPLSEGESGIQQKYLETIQFFLNTGLRNLCSAVRHCVEKELMNVSLKKLFTHNELVEVINKLRAGIERTSDGLKESPFLEYVTSCPATTGPTVDDDAQLSLSHLVRDTDDILKSEDYHVVLQATIDSGFERMLTNLSKVFTSTTTDPLALRSGFGAHNGVALAKLLPPLAGTIHTICSDTLSDYLQQLLTSQCIDDFVYQVYESYSCPATPS